MHLFGLLPTRRAHQRLRHAAGRQQGAVGGAAQPQQAHLAREAGPHCGGRAAARPRVSTFACFLCDLQGGWVSRRRPGVAGGAGKLAAWTAHIYLTVSYHVCGCWHAMLLGTGCVPGRPNKHRLSMWPEGAACIPHATCPPAPCPLPRSCMENVVKECEEEASIPTELAARATAVGAVSYTSLQVAGRGGGGRSETGQGQQGRAGRVVASGPCPCYSAARSKYLAHTTPPPASPPRPCCSLLGSSVMYCTALTWSCPPTLHRGRRQDWHCQGLGPAQGVSCAGQPCRRGRGRHASWRCSFEQCMQDGEVEGFMRMPPPQCSLTLRRSPTN